MMLLINQLYVKGFHPHPSKLFVKNSLSLLSRPSSRIARIRGQNHENPEIDNLPKSNVESHPLFEKAASNFRLLGVTDELINGLCDQSITVPTPVQKEVIPRILQKQNIVMAASTGSGKTLAYVLPAMQHLQTEEQFGYQRLPQRPRCLILVPTRELATQVLQTVKELSHHYKVSSAAVMGGETYSLQRKSLDRLVDIVVASPGRLLQHKERGNLFLSQVNYIVIDEVDTMLTQGFGSDIRAILRSTMLRKDIFRPQTQVIMATATLTKAVKSLLSDVEGNKFDIEFSDPENKTPKKLSPRATLEMKIIEVDGVHRTLPHVKHIFEETKGMDKLIILKSLLERSSNKGSDGGIGRTLIFCNTISSCRAVEYAVNEYNTALAYHGDMPSDERSNNLLKFRNGDVSILIGTDIAARGLDIPEIDHVILFDFPMNSVDYIHRAGRCGRAGRKGTVTSIVTKRDQILAGAIQAATEKGLPIDSLSASKKDYKPEGKLSHILRKTRATKTSSTAPLKKTSSGVGVPTETRPAKKKEERITPLVIRSRRLEFKKKQQELVKENYKFMKNTVAKGRRGRITKKNPVLVPPKLKSRLSKPKKGELEGGGSSEGREGSKGSKGGNRPSARGGARQGRPSIMSKRR